MSEDNKLIIDMLKNIHEEVGKVKEKIGDVREEQLRQNFATDKNTDKIKDMNTDMAVKFKEIDDKITEKFKLLDNVDEAYRSRFEELEAPRKTLRFIGKTSAAIGGFAGMIVGIYKLLEYFKA